MKARDVMSKTVIRCAPFESLERAAQLMWDNDCGCLPVVDDDMSLVGMITDRDICMAAYTRGIRLCDALVSSVMSQPAWSCAPEDDVAEIEQLMAHKQIRRVPVLDMGLIVGMVTLADIVRSAHEHPVRGVLALPSISKTFAAITAPRGVAAAAE